MLQITVRLPVCTFERGLLLTDKFLSLGGFRVFYYCNERATTCTVKFELLRSSETDHVTPLYHSSPIANLISGLLQVFHWSKLQKQQNWCHCWIWNSQSKLLFLHVLLVSSSSSGLYGSPQWIISLNVLHHYIHEPPLKPPPFLLHHWPFLTIFSSQNFFLAILCTSWFIDCPPCIIHSLIHQKLAFYFLNTLSLLVSKCISILNHTNLLHFLSSLMNLSRESMEVIFFPPGCQVSTHLSLLLSFFHHSLCF